MTSSGPVSMETLPDHVSPDMVRPFPFPDGRTTNDNPFTTIIPDVVDGPAAFYTLDGYHGMAPMWVFRRYDDMQAIYLDTEHFSNKGFAPHSELVNGTWHLVPAESDPPDHQFHRGLVNPLFTPKKMAALDGHVRQTARAIIQRFKDRGQCDFVTDLALEFPITVFLELMGWPASDRKQYLAWENQLIHPTSIEDMRQGTADVIQFLRDMIGERRKKPGEDFISYGINAERDGRKLTEDELLGFCFNLFIGGLDTVSTNMGWQARHLAENPEQQHFLRTNPDRIPKAVEELLRRYAAVTTARRCIKDVTVSGIQLRAGDVVAMSTPLGNNDPDQFEDPFTVKLDRNPRHISFAYGIHFCVGSPLARRELIISIEELLRALPEFSLRQGIAIESKVSSIIQMSNLPLEWNT